MIYFGDILLNLYMNGPCQLGQIQGVKGASN